MVLLHVQWLKTTRTDLGSAVCSNTRLYDVRGPGAGPRGHELMLPCLMAYKVEVHNHLLSGTLLDLCVVVYTTINHRNIHHL